MPPHFASQRALSAPQKQKARRRKGCNPYTKIEFLQKDMMVGRQTAAKYLDKIVEEGLLQKLKMGRDNYYVNIRLMELIMNHSDNNALHVDPVESKTE